MGEGRGGGRTECVTFSHAESLKSAWISLGTCRRCRCPSILINRLKTGRKECQTDLGHLASEVSLLRRLRIVLLVAVPSALVDLLEKLLFVASLTGPLRRFTVVL